MAKTISLTDALAALSVLADGNEEVQNFLDGLKENAHRDAARIIFDRKLESGSDSEAWADEMMVLAGNIASELVGEAKTIQGGAVRTVRMFGFETPVGFLQVSLKSEVTD